MSNDKAKSATTAQWKLDRLAERTPEVLARNAHKSEKIGAFSSTLPASAIESGDVDVPYLERMVSELQPLIERAGGAYQAWQDAMVEAQERRQALRESAARFEDELIVFRIVLRGVLGSTHRDYQYLRTHRVQRAELQAAQADAEPEARIRNVSTNLRQSAFEFYVALAIAA